MKQERPCQWKDMPGYGEYLYERAIGHLEEMEAAKSTCDLLVPIYRKGMRILDVGCGAGHYLRSLRERLDPVVDYTGVDAIEYYLRLAKKAHGSQQQFVLGDIYNLGFEDDSFDVVICNNLLCRLPPPPKRPIAELARVSRMWVILRTYIGYRTYIIKEVLTREDIRSLPEREGSLISGDGTIQQFNFLNMYSEQYIRDVVAEIGEDSRVEIDVSIQKDDKWQEFDNRDDRRRDGTVAYMGKQISGNLVQDWRFIVLKKT